MNKSYKEKPHYGSPENNLIINLVILGLVFVIIFGIYLYAGRTDILISPKAYAFGRVMGIECVGKLATALKAIQESLTSHPWEMNNPGFYKGLSVHLTTILNQSFRLIHEISILLPNLSMVDKLAVRELAQQELIYHIGIEAKTYPYLAKLSGGGFPNLGSFKLHKTVEFGYQYIAMAS